MGYPKEPNTDEGGEADNRYGFRCSRLSSNQSRTRPRYGHMARRQRLMSPRQTRHAISRRTSASVARIPSSARGDPAEEGTVMVRLREWAARVSGAPGPGPASPRRPRPSARSQSDKRG